MKRLFGIRHIRYCYLALKFYLWWSLYARHFWLMPHDSDFEYLLDVWQGRA